MAKSKYYVNNNEQSNGDHEVHHENCVWISIIKDKLYLGEFYHCRDAVDAAKLIYSKADGCSTCSPECHKS